VSFREKKFGISFGFPEGSRRNILRKNGHGWLTFFINKNILTKSFTLYNGNLVR